MQNETTLERRLIDTEALAATPAAFRAQERFWEEVRQRIEARRPADAPVLERLY